MMRLQLRLPVTLPPNNRVLPKPETTGITTGLRFWQSELRAVVLDKVLIKNIFKYNNFYVQVDILNSVAEPHHFDAAPDPAAPAPTLLYSKAKFLKQTKV
jgi:hypothetical protein